MAYIFFDQNVIEKLSKKRHTLFQNNINRLLSERTREIDQLFTPFSILEFSGYKLKNILNVKHKNKNLNKYQFQSYKELKNESTLNHFKKQINEQITKPSLKNKLKEKKDRELKYLNERGVNYIDKYIKELDNSSLYNNLIHNLFLDQLSQINISSFPVKDKENFIALLTQLVVDTVCKKNIMGSFRMTCKIFEEMRKVQKQKNKINTDFFNTIKQITIFVTVILQIKKNSY